MKILKNKILNNNLSYFKKSFFLSTYCERDFLHKFFCYNWLFSVFLLICDIFSLLCYSDDNYNDDDNNNNHYYLKVFSFQCCSIKKFLLKWLINAKMSKGRKKGIS